MRIGIIGSGNMGAAFAVRFSEAGHEVAVANSRGPESLSGLVEETGGRARAATVEEASAFGDVVFLTVPYKAAGETLERGSPWDGRILVDVTNYYEQRDGVALVPPVEGSSTVVATNAPGARVVKAFNTIYFRHLRGDGGMGGRGRRAIPIAGDDEEAKRVVAELVDELGFEPVDLGDLEDGVLQEPGHPIYNQALTADELRARL